MIPQCPHCHAELELVSCEPCGGLGADPEGEGAKACDECSGEGAWYECPMVEGGECDREGRIERVEVE